MLSAQALLSQAIAALPIYCMLISINDLIQLDKAKKHALDRVLKDLNEQ